jgi:hypothetical protein
MEKLAFSLFAFLLFAVPILSEQKLGIIVTGGDDSIAVVQVLVHKFRDSKSFEPVYKDDSAIKAALLVECMHREREGLPLACMYVVHYSGATSKTFISAGLRLSMTVEEMADLLFAAVAADIAEKWNRANKENLRASLESCLFLTDSKCNVPVPLQDELNATELSLRQYLNRNK